MPDRRWVFAGMAVVVLAIGLIVRALVRPQPVLIDGVAVRGDAAFVERTREALRLIEAASRETYTGLTRQVLTIRQHGRSGAEVVSRQINVADPTSRYSPTWYASSLVHDCRHIAQYQDYLAAYPDRSVPYSIYTGPDAEMNCMVAQIDILERMNAPAHELEWARKQDGTFHDTNRDGKYDDADYRKRDW